MERSYAIHLGGRIRLICTGTVEAVWANLPEGGEAIQAPRGVSPNTHYVVDRQIQPRPANPATLSGLTLNHLPGEYVISINGRVYPGTESTVELEFDQPGTYTVRIECWPYLDKEFEIENPPQ